jgi:hypothetical protein
MMIYELTSNFKVLSLFLFPFQVTTQLDTHRRLSIPIRRVFIFASASHPPNRKNFYSKPNQSSRISTNLENKDGEERRSEVEKNRDGRGEKGFETNGEGEERAAR